MEKDQLVKDATVPQSATPGIRTLDSRKHFPVL